MTGEPTTKLLVHEVPKVPGTYIRVPSPSLETNLDNLLLTRDQLDGYTYQHINLTTSAITLCHRLDEDLCCDFEIEVSIQAVDNDSVSLHVIFDC